MFDKREIKEQTGIEEIEEILEALGAHFYRENDEKLIIETICHNPIGAGSHKLYYYENTKLFNCYSNCGSFDVFELVIKSRNQEGKEMDLDEAVRWVAERKGFFFFGESSSTKEKTIEEPPEEYSRPVLNGYERTMFDRLKPVLVKDWLEENIDKESHQKFEIKYNPIDGAVLFPHYDELGSLVGIRQRNLVDDMVKQFGKYRPATLRGITYTSPLSFYLYGAYQNKHNIKRTKRAIVFEGEKSVMKMESFFGSYYNNSVACFGINFSRHHFEILKELGAKEIVFAFDRQYLKSDMEDSEYLSLTKKLQKTYERFSNQGITISFMMDFDNLLDYKDSPIDKGPVVFNRLFENRFTLGEDEIGIEV